MAKICGVYLRRIRTGYPGKGMNGSTSLSKKKLEKFSELRPASCSGILPTALLIVGSVLMLPNSVGAATKSTSKTAAATTIKVSATKTTIKTSATAKPAPAVDLQTEIQNKIVSVQAEAAPGLKVEKARCPSTLAVSRAKLKVGTYECTVLIDGVEAPYTVTIEKGGFLKGGAYRLEAAKTILDLRTIAEFVREDLEPDVQATAKISCGAKRVALVKKGDTVTCKVTGGGAISSVSFKVLDKNGTVAIIV